MKHLRSNVHQELIEAGLVLAHVGTRAATVDFPGKSVRIQLEDIPKLKDLLDRVARSLVRQQQ